MHILMDDFSVATAAAPQPHCNNRVQRHVNYVVPEFLRHCYNPTSFIAGGRNETCNYVRDTKTCYDMVKLINYLDFFVCTLEVDKSFQGLMLLVIVFSLILIIYTAFIIILTKYFFLPNLLTVAKRFHTTSFEYGVSIIAAIICIPDLTHRLISCANYHFSITMILSEYLGIVFGSFTFGMIILCYFGRNYRVNIVYFLCSIFFLIFGSIYMVEMFRQQMIEARFQHLHHQRMDSNTHLKHHIFIFLAIHLSYIIFCYIYAFILRRRTLHQTTVATNNQQTPTISNTSTTMVASNHDNDELPSDQANISSISLLFHAYNPFVHMKGCSFLIVQLTYPIWVIATTCVPVIDDRRPLCGWCKYLTCVSFLVYPAFCLLVQTNDTIMYVLIGFSIIAFLLTLIFTTPHKKPRCDYLYAIFGAVVGSTFFYIFDCEIDTLLWQLISYYFRFTNDATSLLIFQYNNNIIQMIVCYGFVQAGYRDLTFGIAMGVAIFELYAALPILAFHVCCNKNLILSVAANTETGFTFLLMCFIYIALSVSMTNFQLRISHSAFLLVHYIVFLVYIWLSMAWVMHPYGTHHAEIISKDYVDVEWT